MCKPNQNALPSQIKIYTNILTSQTLTNFNLFDVFFVIQNNLNHITVTVHLNVIIIQALGFQGFYI